MTSLPEQLILPVAELRQRALMLERDYHTDLSKVAPAYRNSARNLLHYLALRQVDVRDLQDDLASLGLSSLGRSEAHTLHTLNAVLRVLHTLAANGAPSGQDIQSDAPVDFKTGDMLLNVHAQQLLGAASGKRSVRIMVTMPSEAATHPDLVRHLLASGMDVMRINCAHDDADAWMKMIEHLRRAERELGRACKVYADLAGPKLRTGTIASSARVLKLRPRRDVKGGVVQPARAWLAPDDELVREIDDLAVVPVTRGLMQLARRGDAVELVDCRGKARTFKIVSVEGALALADCDQTVYLETGMPLRLIRKKEAIAEGCVGGLPAVVEPIQLTVGDTFILTRDDKPGHPAKHNAKGEVTEPARISCSLEHAFGDVKPGHRIWFDDGKIGGRVASNDGDQMTVQITHAASGGAKLGPEKGINLPDTQLGVSALTPKDLDDLAFMASRVDMIGLSFVRVAEDVQQLEAELKRLKAHGLGIVLKIENRLAFENLPKLLLAGMRWPPIGVMVARGDLAVEVGFERLAEVQEEILWLCEAAHVPVIWATQVLESVAKKGVPSRAEVSDAVMSGRAECVMLNKGPYVVEVVRFLSGLLERMAAHQDKKRTRLRRLSVSQLA